MHVLPEELIIGGILLASTSTDDAKSVACCISPELKRVT